MNRNTKKGFTIVELIIVIAVIAVLAAVLIPTFSNLINQAQQAKDTALVSDLNKGLKMSGKEFDTMHDALAAVEENVGINVAKINAVATDSEILWDSVNQCFVYLKGGETTPTYIPDTQKTPIAANEQYKYWQIVEETSKTATYSQYLAGTNYKNDVEVNTGFDAGDNTQISSVKYENLTGEHEVILRTLSGALEVNAPSDTVNRYGSADKVTITAIAPSSYHEFGEATLIVLKQGRVVAENGANVAQINIPEDANVSSVKVDVETSANVAAVTTVKDVAFDSITIKSNNTAYVNKTTNNYVAFVGKTGFNSLNEAISSATSGQKIILMKDSTESSSFSTILANKELTIDLNGCKLNFVRFNLDEEDGGTQTTVESLTFVDSGLTKGKMICKGTIAVCMGPSDTVVLNGVDLECSTYGLYPRGNAAKLEVKNSHITAPVYAIATNASTTANGGVVISIDGSVIEAVASHQDNTAVQINVDSTTTITNSTIKGQRQALMVRGGDAVIENTIIEKTGTKASSDYADYNDENKTWGQGNQVPAYALVLGNRSTAYQYPTNVTLKSVTIKGGIYAWGNSTAGLETTIIFESNVIGTLTSGENVSVIGTIKEK